MNLSKILLFFILCFSFIFSSLSHAAVIGKNDLVLVNDDFSNIPDKFKTILPAIGLMNTPCTVAHIGQGFVITAGHCFWQTYYDGALYTHQACSGETIRWKQTSGNANPKISNCLQIIAMQRNPELNLDYAIIKVSEPPVEKVFVDWKANVPAAGTILTIFSHPDEAPLSWSKYCRIKKITAKDVSPNLLHHVCDAKQGSSGAAVFNAVTGEVVALHISSDGEPNTDGSTTNVATENYAMYIVKSPLKNILQKAGYVFDDGNKK